MQRRPSALKLVLGLMMVCISSAALAQYQLTNLVSNQVGQAKHTDPLLVNAWGLTNGPGSPFWISDNGSGWSTLTTAKGTSRHCRFPCRRPVDRGRVRRPESYSTDRKIFRCKAGRQSSCLPRWTVRSAVGRHNRIPMQRSLGPIVRAQCRQGSQSPATTQGTYCLPPTMLITRWICMTPSSI